jgi:inner membrane protein
MNPIVHGELSWLVAQRLQARRDRVIVTVAGLSPDLDGLSLLGGTDAYARWHHVLLHGIAAAVLVATVSAALGRQRLQVALLAFLAFHLHLACDFVGSGPGWGLSYWWPFSVAEVSWAGQWDLASWQNAVIGLAATLACLACARFFGRTPVELFSVQHDAAVVKTVRARIG